MGGPRGEDFSRKFARGEWAEQLLIDAIGSTDGYTAIQYGISRGDALETSEELEAIKEPDAEDLKRPDLLVYADEFLSEIPVQARDLLEEFAEGSPEERADVLEEFEEAGFPQYAECAIESESSKFAVEERTYSSSLSVFVKDEDYTRLRSWVEAWDVPVNVVQLFLDQLYAVPMDRAHPAYEGVRHGSIPGIYKDGVIVDLDSPFCLDAGSFVEDPEIVDGPESEEPIGYDFTDGGKIVSSDGDPFFSGGEITVEDDVVVG